MTASFALHYLKNRFAIVERGASLVEYTLVLALIAVVAIGALTFIGDGTKDKLDSVGHDICTTEVTVVGGDGASCSD